MPTLRRSAAALLVAPLVLAASPAVAQRAADAPQAPALERIGAGRLAAFRQGSNTLLLVPPDAIGKPFVWYTEVVGVPAGMVADGGLEVAEGPLPGPALFTVRIPSRAWVDILEGSARLETAYLRGRLRIEGEVTQVLRLKDMLGL